MNILIGICGSISCYKSIEICRNLIKEGHSVKVVFRKSAHHFLKKDLFTYLGADVYDYMDDFKLSSNKVLHVELKKWADIIAVLPASANFISTLYATQCDDLLTTTILTAHQKKIILFPAMNPSMWSNPLLQEKIEKISSVYDIISPDMGETLCGDLGQGRLPAQDKISSYLNTLSLTHSNKKILITAGATLSPIDAVRFVSNPATGSLAYYLSIDLLKKGHKVFLISAPQTNNLFGELSLNKRFKEFKVNTTDEMYSVVSEHFDFCDTYISTAAISDIKFNKLNYKLKKSNFPNSLEISSNIDILKEMIKRKKDQFIIGFAAESELNKEVIEEKFKRKPVDILVANSVNNGLISGTSLGWGRGANQFFIKTKRSLFEKRLSKKDLSLEIIKKMEELW